MTRTAFPAAIAALARASTVGLGEDEPHPDHVRIFGPVMAGVDETIVLAAVAEGADGPPSFTWRHASGPAAVTLTPAGETCEVTGRGLGEAVIEVSFSDGLCDNVATSTLTVLFVPSDGYLKPGDINLDGNLDISDAIALLGHLFVGIPASLPCGDGTVLDSRNLSLLDANGDGGLDLSDAIRVLSFIFLGADRPAPCRSSECECIVISGCSVAWGCS